MTTVNDSVKDSVTPVPFHSDSDTIPNTPGGEFLELRQIIKKEGLLERQPGYYVFKVVSTLALLAAAIAFLFIVDNFWLRLLDAVFLGFVFTQIGFLGHDSGHRQMFRSIKRNDWMMLLVVFLIALDRSWWLNKHNRHHSNPNQPGLDDDINVIVLSFSETQSLATKGLARFVVKYQAYFFFPLLMLTGFSMRGAGVVHLMANRRNDKFFVIEMALIAAHFTVYFALVWFAIGSWWQVILFIMLHQSMLGLYMGSVFAPNHKGMMLIEGENTLDFMRSQVLTARNILPSRFADFWFGGLNYQIEHHLFPVMPRNRLGAARRVIKQFCNQHDISYHETGIRQSFVEILSHLHRVSAPLRRKNIGVKSASPELQAQDD